MFRTVMYVTSSLAGTTSIEICNENFQENSVYVFFVLGLYLFIKLIDVSQKGFSNIFSLTCFIYYLVKNKLISFQCLGLFYSLHLSMLLNMRVF